MQVVALLKGYEFESWRLDAIFRLTAVLAA